MLVFCNCHARPGVCYNEKTMEDTRLDTKTDGNKDELMHTCTFDYMFYDSRNRFPGYPLTHVTY